MERAGDIFSEALRLLRERRPRLRFLVPLLFAIGMVQSFASPIVQARVTTAGQVLFGLVLTFVLYFWVRSALIRTLFGRERGVWRMDWAFWRYVAADLPLIIALTVLPPLAAQAAWMLISIVPAPGYLQWAMWACVFCAAGTLVQALTSRIWPWITALLLDERLTIRESWRATKGLWGALAGVAAILAFGFTLPHLALLSLEARLGYVVARLVLIVADGAWLCVSTLVAAALSVVIYRLARARDDPSEAFS